MKSLLLVRHAKSSWDSPSLSDFDRPLNDRGNKDAPKMAKRLKEKGIEIDLFVSSTAVRAISTARYFIKAYEAKKSRIIELPELYHPAVNIFYDVIAQLDDKFDSVAIFSHNPGITEMINTLGVARLDNMPTCGVFAVKADIKSWAEFRNAVKQLWFFNYPKLED